MVRTALVTGTEGADEDLGGQILAAADTDAANNVPSYGHPVTLKVAEGSRLPAERRNSSASVSMFVIP